MTSEEPDHEAPPPSRRETVQSTRLRRLGKEKQKPISSIFRRILFACLAPVVFIVIVITFTITNVIVAQTEEVSRQKADELEKRTTRRLEESISTFGSILDTASEGLRLLAGDSFGARWRAERLMRHIMETNPDIYAGWFVFEPGKYTRHERFETSLLRTDTDIKRVYDQSEEILDDPEKSSWYHIPLRTGKPLFWGADFYDYRDGDGGKFVCSIIRPVLAGGDPIGVMGFDLRYESFYKYVADWREAGDINAFLVESSGIILYGENQGFMGKSLPEALGDATSAETIRTALKEKNAVRVDLDSPFLGEKAMAYLSPIKVNQDETNLLLYVEVPKSLLFQQANASRRIVISTSLIGLLLLAASVFFATRNIVRPIQNITQKAHQIAGGRLDVSFDFDEDRVPRHEVDLLEGAIRQMVAQLGQTHQLKLANIASDFEKRRIIEEAKAREKFFASMAHEIRTPMNAILGMSELLMDEKLADPPGQYVRDIKISATALLTTVNDLLDFSKIESGKLSLVNEDYDLRRLMNNLSSICRILTREKNLDFACVIKEGTPGRLHGDEVRLRQILMNLLGNAVKFTPAGKVTLSVEDEGPTLRFDVQDNGIGLREEDQRHLFEPYRQFDVKANRQIKGTGLGLSICKSLVTMMNGDIFVTSTYGSGSTFSIRIPKVLAHSAKLSETSSDIRLPYRLGARALVVDDNMVNLTVAKGLLGKVGLQCDLVESGTAALSKLGETDYDIVFMDHMMPDMDGLEATQKIRAMGDKFARLTVIALTANAADGSREQYLSAGMNDVLTKPIERKKLQSVLAKWLPVEKRLSSRLSGSEK